MIVDLTLLAGTQIQLSGVLEERFKARDLRCPQAARAVPLVSQNDKVESSRSAEKILGSGEKYRCPRTHHYNSLVSSDLLVVILASPKR